MSDLETTVEFIISITDYQPVCETVSWKFQHFLRHSITYTALFNLYHSIDKQKVLIFSIKMSITNTQDVLYLNSIQIQPCIKILSADIKALQGFFQTWLVWQLSCQPCRLPVGDRVNYTFRHVVVKNCDKTCTRYSNWIKGGIASYKRRQMNCLSSIIFIGWIRFRN